MKRVIAVAVVGLMLSVGFVSAPVAAATKTTATWKVSSMTAGQVKSLSNVATSNSPGVKTWSKTGSCNLTPTSKPTTLTMGAGEWCYLTLKIAKSGKYPAKTSTKTITRKSKTPIAPTKCKAGSCAVGDTGPGGGIIFYVDLTRVAGSRYFEVACAGWYEGSCLSGSDLWYYRDPTFSWWDGDSVSAVPGAEGTAIGTGEQNTTDILMTDQLYFIAANIADVLVFGGQSDWFLPSKDELNELCKYARNTGQAAGADIRCKGGSMREDFQSDRYWSSSETGDNYPEYAWLQIFTNGSGDPGGQYSFGYGTEKIWSYPVRPIRSF